LFDCINPNRVNVVLEDFDTENNVVIADLGQLLALVIGYWLLVICYLLLVICYLLLVISYWLFVISYVTKELNSQETSINGRSHF